MGELDDRVNEAIRAAFSLTLVTGCCAAMMYIGYRNLAGAGVIGSLQKKEEITLSYESEEVRALAYSAIKRRGLGEQELHRIDRDKDGKITESEVLFYVRNK